MSSQEITDSLTPFTATLRDAAESAVRALFGVPDTVPLRWKRRSTSDTWALHVVIGEDTSLLEFDLGPAGKHRWVDGATFSASYRRYHDGTDPHDDPGVAGLLRTVGRRLEAAGRHEAGVVWKVTERALARDEQVANIPEHVFRAVSPGAATVRLGFRCNQDCGFCWQNRDWPEPDLALYEIWIDELAAAGVSRLFLTGGEPTIHRQFADLTKRAVDRGMSVAAETNAIQLARDGVALGMRQLGINQFFVSFHSNRTEVSEAMTRAPGTHARTVAGIAAALDAGHTVALNCVVERRNTAHLAEHAAFIVERFVQPFPDNPLQGVSYSHPESYNDLDAYSRYLVPLDEVSGPLHDACTILEAANLEVVVQGTCGFPACVLRDHPARVTAFERSVQSQFDLDGRIFSEICAQCVFRPHCIGIRREYYAVYRERGIVPFTANPLSMSTR